ncbi:MAG: hypothetical protein ACKVK0_15685, partial [Pirellulales bacterium]
MSESKKSHWKSLAADLSGSESENENPVNEIADSDTSPTDLSTELGDLPAPTTERTSSVEHATADVDEVAIPADTEDSTPKKKKRGSWAFWRSGNKEKKDSEGDSDGSDSSVSEDPLALLNQAETTDDMASAIDQLFANTATDTHVDELVFDTEEIAMSIDFEEEPQTTSRESDGDDSGRNKGSRTRRDQDKTGQRESRGRDDRNSGRSRGRRSDDRSQGGRSDDRSRGRRSGDRSQDQSSDDRSQGGRSDD